MLTFSLSSYIKQAKSDSNSELKTAIKQNQIYLIQSFSKTINYESLSDLELNIAYKNKLITPLPLTQTFPQTHYMYIPKIKMIF